MLGGLEIYLLLLFFFSAAFTVSWAPYFCVPHEPVKCGLLGLQVNQNKNQVTKNLVVFNAIGRKSNLILIEHARRNVFSQDDWDCIAFMYADEDRIENDAKYLQLLKDNLGCSISRMPGLYWGDFLHFISPTLTSNYNYISIVLDDVFIPLSGDHKVDVNEMLARMKENGIDVFSPCVINDTFESLRKAQRRGLEECIGEVDYIEIYFKLFTRDAWVCFFNMLHYSGKRGWFYDVLFKDFCPNLTLAQDFSMWAWHMDKTLMYLPVSDFNTRELSSWKFESNVNASGYYNMSGDLFCNKIGCSVDEMVVRYEEDVKREIWCPLNGIL